MKHKILIFFFSMLCSGILSGQNPAVKFAYIADPHVCEGSSTIDDLKACIDDINADPGIQFSIIAGDITEFGADREIGIAKNLLDRLKNPYYVVAGNHDAKWSESGCNTFAKVFGYEHFDFEKSGVKFIGCNSGPDMRMAPALVPRESILWLDSLVHAIDRDQPLIFINHYPMDSSVLNCFEVTELLKKANIRLVMGGHWHRDVVLNYDGIPGVLGRSSQARGKDGPGYNIVTIQDGIFSMQERIASTGTTKAPWFTLPMKKGTDYSVNTRYPQVQKIWTILEPSNIGCGAAVSQGKFVYATTQGKIKCFPLERSCGSTEALWEFQTDGKIFSTPAICEDHVVIGSCDNHIYCLDLKDGSLIWKEKCNKSVLASPAIYDGTVYIGASDGIFRALDLKTGRMIWKNDGIQGFVEARAMVDKKQVVIGDWGNRLYSFNRKNGKLMWTWHTKGSRMYSPAAVWPVKSEGKIFIVTPKRMTYAIDAEKGTTLWEHRGGRESIGISPDGSTVYVKTMKDTVFAFQTGPDHPERVWAADCRSGYEISPTPIAVADYVFLPSDRGFITALDPQDGKVVWKHRVSHALVNCILPVEGRRLLVTTMDGKVALLSYGE